MLGVCNDAREGAPRGVAGAGVRLRGSRLVMDLFGRYVFRQTASAFVLIVLTLTIIVWLATVLKELNLITAQGQGLWLFLQMTALALPNLMALIAPNAFLMACLHTLDRLNGDSELIVMTASGAPVWRLAAPFLALAAITSVLIAIVNFYLMPTSMRALRDFVGQVRTDLISQVLRPGQFSSPVSGLTFHIRDRSATGDLLGIVVHDERNSDQIMTYLAERGRIVRSGDSDYLAMFGGQIHRNRPSEKQKGTQIVAFEQYIFDISQFGPTTGPEELKPRERYLGELLNPDPKDPVYSRYPGRFRSEIHDRFATLLYPFVFAMVAVGLLGQARSNREGRWNMIFLAFGLAIVTRAAGLAATNLLTAEAWAVSLVYGIPVTAILVATWAARARMSPESRSKGSLDLPYRFRLLMNRVWPAGGTKTQ